MSGYDCAVWRLLMLSYVHFELGVLSDFRIVKLE